MRRLTRAFIFLASLSSIPAVAHAQASIAGVVKDTSGAVLPGVTVEAASDALIEKVRIAGHRRHRPVTASSTCGRAPTRSRSR